MERTVACGCGKVIVITEEMAGPFVRCDCGATVVVAPIGELPVPADDGAAPAVAFFPSLEEINPDPALLQEIIAPTQVSVRTRRGGESRAEARTALMAALTRDALWIQDTWRLRCLPLHHIQVEKAPGGKELGLTLRDPESPAETLSLSFASPAEADRWNDKINEWQSKHDPAAPPVRRTVPEGVALVHKAPEGSHEAVGSVAFLHRTAGTADRGLQLRAGIRGANAIVDLAREKCPEMESGARQVSGQAIRVEDADTLIRFRWRWYAEELGGLVKRMLLLVFIEALAVFAVAAFFQGKAPLSAATGQTLSESIASAGLSVVFFFGWPLVLIVLLAVLRWRELLRPAGFAVLAATTLAGLIIVLAHLLAVLNSGASLAESKIGYLADPVDWALMIAGVVLCVRAWQLHSRVREILPEEALIASRPRKLWSRGLTTATGLIALLSLGLFGPARYDVSLHLVQKGVDPRREQEASLALNEGAAHANKGNLEAAEQSFQRSLRLWEALTAGGAAPSIYRINLAVTLMDLGWIRLKQARYDEAETYYSRGVALADQVSKDPQLDEETRRTLDGARQTLASLREEKSRQNEEKASGLLDQKSADADRKFEEAEVKNQKGEPGAEPLYREAIAQWEEVLPHATAEAYRKEAFSRLSVACVHLGELQKEKNDRVASETSLKKAIDYSEKAVALDPNRPLLKHNLGEARRSLEILHDQSFQEDVAKLGRAGRFADAVDFFTRGIDELDGRVRTGKDVDLAVPSLAQRLDRFAWFLAHSPDPRTRDTKAAVAHARRATELRPDMADYCYTLAMVQYRNGDWRDSLATLEKMKASQGGFGASDWLVSAMDLYHLDRKEEARAALRKATEWIDAQLKKAETDVGLRLEFELMRPTLEELLWEARKVLGGEVRAG